MGAGIGAETGAGGGTEGGLGAERVACTDAPEGSNGVLSEALESMCIGETTLNPSSLLSLPLLSPWAYELEDSTSLPGPTSS